MIKCYYHYIYFLNKYLGEVYIDNIYDGCISEETYQKLIQIIEWFYGYNVLMIYQGIMKDN